MGFFGMFIRVVAQFWGTLFIPYAVTRLLDYAAVNYDISIPWPIDMFFVPIVAFFLLYILALVCNTWWYAGKCGARGKSYKRLIFVSALPPIMAIGGSFALNYIPLFAFIKIPLMLIDKVLWVASFLPFLGWATDLVDGVYYIPGYFAALMMLVPIMALSVKC